MSLSVFGCNPQLTRVYTPPKNRRNRGTILSLNGESIGGGGGSGSGGGGSTDCNREQNEMLASSGYQVHQLALPNTAELFAKWRDGDAMAEFLEQQRNSFGPIFVIGRSSAGYLAALFRQRYAMLIEKAVFICPLLCPCIYDGNPHFEIESHNETVLEGPICDECFLDRMSDS